MATKKVKKESESSTNVSYKGNVVIKVVRDNKLVKKDKFNNTGYISLFSFLANCIRGNFIGDLTPEYIVCYYVNNNVETRLNNVPIKVTSSYVNNTATEPSSSTASLNFIVPGLSLITSEAEYVVINRVKLFCNNNRGTIGTENENPSAIIDLGEQAISIPKSTIDKYTAYITWNLTIGNQSAS